MESIQTLESFRVTTLGSVNRLGLGHSGCDYFFSLCQFALVRPLILKMRQCSCFVVRPGVPWHDKRLSRRCLGVRPARHCCNTRTALLSSRPPAQCLPHVTAMEAVFRNFGCLSPVINQFCRIS